MSTRCSRGTARRPRGLKLNDGMNYNKFFPGNQIAMPQPLTDGAVTFADGTPNTLQQEAKERRHLPRMGGPSRKPTRARSMGWRVMLFLIPLAFLLYAVKRRVWAKLH